MAITLDQSPMMKLDPEEEKIEQVTLQILELQDELKKQIGEDNARLIM